MYHAQAVVEISQTQEFGKALPFQWEGLVLFFELLRFANLLPAVPKPAPSSFSIGAACILWVAARDSL